MSGPDAMLRTARTLVAAGKGLLAMDESPGTCNTRFAQAGIPLTEAMRRSWRELLLTAPDLASGISGVILHDETMGQASRDGTSFIEVARQAGILVGIKVDTGANELAGHPGEKVTEGLDGLRARLQAYADAGAAFAKWRAVIAVSEVSSRGCSHPSSACVDTNAHALGRFAALCQEVGLVPVVEPEVLMEGSHSLRRCREVSEGVLRSVFDQLVRQGVLLEAVILKSGMIAAGLACEHQTTPAEVADATLACLLRVVPAAVPGIAFLSGGQSGELACARLNAIHARFGPSGAVSATAPPWPLTFSFARALQHPAMEIWAGKDANRAEAQAALLHRVQCNRAALQGGRGVVGETH